MRFHPSLHTTLALLPLAAAFAWLGAWQWQRMHEKETLMTRFAEAPLRAYVDAAGAEEPFTRVTVTGRYEDAWHVLRDNRIENGRAGVHVITLFRPMAGPPLLVNRGWLPLPPDRRSLPAVPTPAREVTLTGLLSPPPDPGVRLGEPGSLDRLDGPTLVTYFDLDRVAAAAGSELLPSVLLLDPEAPTGFGERDWSPTVMLPGQHRAYAVQWFALSLAALIIWCTLGIRRASTDAGQGNSGGTDR